MGVKQDVFKDSEEPIFHDIHANGIVEEINNMIKASGLAIDPSDFEQLKKALDLLYTTNDKAKKTYLTKDDAAATYLTINNAKATYLSKADANTIYESKADMAANYITIADISANYSPLTDNAAFITKEIGSTTTNTDLNNITTSGWYRSEMYANKFTNKPSQIGEGSAFVLMVQGIQPDINNKNSRYVKQILYRYDFINSYSRYRSYNQQWSAWVSEIYGELNGATIELSM